MAPGIAGITAEMTPSEMTRAFSCLLFLTISCGVQAQSFVTYVGELGTDHVTLAWGTTAADNTIGRSSKSHGSAVVRVGTVENTVTDQNWTTISGLQPDTEYEYEVRLNGRKIGGSTIRTWAAQAEKLRFFVIGDYGIGDEAQVRIGQAMAKEFDRLQGDNPVRFVITTGDNIYGQFGFGLRFTRTGDKDTEWGRKFFGPYGPVLARIPFYPSLGNHDGNETESRADLAQYLDNFFFPSPQPARYYRFSYGNLADFFALDSTTNAETGPTRPAFLDNGDQTKWLALNLSESRAPWKVPYFHHPPFNAGPRHPAAKEDLLHWLRLFEKGDVKVVFNGHEHNYQHSFLNGATGGIRYVISGSGGELREADVTSQMRRAEIEAWAPVNEFLSVEIEGKEMRVMPVGAQPFDVLDRDRRKVSMPLRVKIP
ncbi:MAG: metallophosphoesterase [Bryobacteraceae bacterium]|nr:metallophosphoesterase [Bryobacteraceae bacterium]